ncbi:miraculin-like [Populus alba x Populus x berolinensis]|nr:miraculin-like [Populus alba x Populus x berolinensis]
MLKLIGSLSCMWLLMAVSTMAQDQPPVLDTAGRPVRSGVEYYILPAATDIAGGLTLVARNGSCPSFVGQEPLTPVVSQGLPVVFSPYVAGETIVRESRSFIIEFSAASTCVSSTKWNLAARDPATSRRNIVIGRSGSYFMITKENNLYYLAFCPADTCNICKFDCGTAGITIENGTRFLTLDGPVFPFRFRRA